MNARNFSTRRLALLLSFGALASLAACAEEQQGDPSSASELRSAPAAVTFSPPTDLGTGTGLVGAYYDNMNFTGLAFTRIDDEINYDWGHGSPSSTMGSNTFSIRWTGYLTPPVDADYRFRLYSDDGSRLLIDGAEIVDNWGDHGPRSRTGDRTLIGGHAYDFVVEYYENTGESLVALDVSINNGPYIPVPETWFSYIIDGTGLYARWWDDRESFDAGDDPVTATVKPSPVIVDHSITLPAGLTDGEDPPAGVAQDQFVVSLGGYIEAPVSGVYEFAVDCTGPYRFAIDAEAVGEGYHEIDEWSAVPTAEGFVSLDLASGDRAIFRLLHEDVAGDSTCRVGWRYPGIGGATDNFEYIPQRYLHPAPFGDGTGLTARYYDNEDFTNLVARRVDPVINFDWGTGSPSFEDATVMGSNSFSIQWRGYIQPAYDETYTLHVTHDDGVRVWIDGVLIVNRFSNGSFESSGTVALNAGEKHEIEIDYYESSSGAFIKLEWSSPSQARSVVPRSQLYPQVVDPNAGTGLDGYYFNSMNHTEFYAQRNDPVINFDWGTASPMPGTAMNANYFSVRWLGQVRPRYSEEYTFTTYSDDGVRLWIDGQLIIDDWLPHAPEYNSATIQLIAGKRYDIRLDYFEQEGGATARLLWSSPSQPLEVVPESRLFPPPALGAGTGLLGTYFGQPDLDPSDLRLIRVDGRVKFESDTQPPDQTLPNSNYSIRWAGSFESVFSEPYTLTLRTNGGVRLYFDGILVIDHPTDPGDTIVERSVTVPMEAGLLYDLVIEYSQADTEGTIDFIWESPSHARQTVPRRQLYPATPDFDVELDQCESVITIDDFTPEDGDDLPEGLAIDEDGLTLQGTSIRSPDIWVANGGNSTTPPTITRINTDNGALVGTYPSATDAAWGRDPSRTAVDLNYDVWVANRAFYSGTARMGSVTKIYSDCECQNPNDLCTECVAFTTTIGNNTIPRGLAIDGQNNVWVGLWGAQQLVKIDNATGNIIATFDAPVRPYGLAIDRIGKIWIAGMETGIGCFDTVTEQPCGSFDEGDGVVMKSGDTCLEPYGIAVDNDMNIWFGNWTCDGLVRLDRAAYDASVNANTDPLTGNTVWNNVTVDIDVFHYSSTSGYNYSQTSRGVAVGLDGGIWLISSHTNRILKFEPETLTWNGAYDASSTPIGVAIADRGSILAVAGSSNSGVGRVYSYTPDGELEWFQDAGPNSYSYSDMTGFQLRTFTAPIGTWSTIIDCADVSEPGCVFDYLTWGATIPDGAQVQVRFRTGTEDPVTGEIIWDDWSPTYSTTPSPLGRDGYQGDYVEVEATLIASPQGEAPNLRTVQFWRCPQIYPPRDFDVDSRWIESEGDNNYAISWQIVDDSWPETRWEFLDLDGNMRCLLDSTTSITKGQLYSAEGQYPACEEQYFLSNVPVTRSVRTAYFDAVAYEWLRSEATEPVTYYTLVNNPTEQNGDMRILGYTYNSVQINWCRPLNNWFAGLTGARVTRWTGSAVAPDPESVTVLADFPGDAGDGPSERGYASDTNTCGTLADTGLEEGTVYYYQLEYQNGDGIASAPLVLSVETYGAPCCDELAQGCEGICGTAVTGPDGCELPPLYEDPEVTCDGIDNNCDGEVDEGLLNNCGYCGPAPAEVCDGIDNDCDGTIDINPVDGPTFYQDLDGDSWGNDGVQKILCHAEPGWVGRAGDCDDTNAAVNPDADEICDGIDNDCDGDIDEDGAEVPYYADSDGDTFGDPDTSTLSCSVPAGYVTDNTDCDDSRDFVYPGAPELCDGLDNNCNGEVDEGWARVDLQIFQVKTTEEFGTSVCQNAFGGLACEGAIAIEFNVDNPSAEWVPTSVEVDIRYDGPTGPRLVSPIDLVRAVAPGMNETYIYCVPASYSGERDLWIGLHNIDDEMAACGDSSDVEPDYPFAGGAEICDGFDNDCNGLVDDNACRVTEVCVETTSPGVYACVGAITEDDDCNEASCVVSCELDDDCGVGAECRSGACVNSEWIADPTSDPRNRAGTTTPSSAAEAEDDMPPSSGGACTQARGTPGASWLLIALGALLLRRRR